MRWCGAFGLWRARNNRIFNNSVREVEEIVEIVETVKVLSWRWTLTRLKVPACMFYDWGWTREIVSCVSVTVFALRRLRLGYALVCCFLLSGMLASCFQFSVFAVLRPKGFWYISTLCMVFLAASFVVLLAHTRRNKFADSKKKKNLFSDLYFLYHFLFIV